MKCQLVIFAIFAVVIVASADEKDCNKDKIEKDMMQCMENCDKECLKKMQSDKDKIDFCDPDPKMKHFTDCMNKKFDDYGEKCHDQIADTKECKECLTKSGCERMNCLARNNCKKQ